MNPSAERRFCIAGLEVCVRAGPGSGLNHMEGFYHHVPSQGGSPQCVVDVDIRPDFHHGRTRGPNYPGFEETHLGPGRMLFSRFDVEGEITVDGSASPQVHGTFIVGHSPNSLEAAIRVAVSIALPAVGALIFHSSAVAGNDGIAQLFMGVSGRGKSTIATMLTNIGATKVSDELVIVRTTPAGAEAIVSPFIGSVGLPYGKSFPISALNMLVQASQHHRRPIAVPEALPQLMRHTVSFAREPTIIQSILDLQLALLAAVPCYELEFAKRADVADAIFLTCQG